MKKILAALLAACALPFAQTPAAASARATWIVRLARGGSESELHARAGAFGVRARWHAIGGLAATLTPEQHARLARDPLVASIEPERTFHIDASTARASYGVTKAVTDFGVTGDRDGAQRTYTRNDVVSCVIDTGIDTSHVDLDQGQVIGWKDFVNGRTTPYDDNGHGTHVSAILAGQGDGNSAYRGVAPGTALVGAKAMNSSGSGTTTAIISAVQWCIDKKSTYNIRIINMSLGGSGSSNGTDALSAAVNAASDAGIVPVVAAGNDGPAASTIGSPAAAAKALTVCSIADPGVKGFSISPWSSRGPTADGRTKPDVCAPGQSITSAKAGSGNGYVTYSGTSMATPFVAGVAALMLDANPALTPSQLKYDITTTTQDWNVAGSDNETGAGRLQAYEAIKRAGGFAGTGPSAPNHYTASSTLRASGNEDQWLVKVTSLSAPIALSLVIPSASGSKDFDLRLRAPNGTILAVSDGTTRQETVGITPAVTGNYIILVDSYVGTGGYNLDLSYLGAAPTLASNG